MILSACIPNDHDTRHCRITAVCIITKPSPELTLLILPPLPIYPHPLQHIQGPELPVTAPHSWLLDKENCVFIQLCAHAQKETTELLRRFPDNFGLATTLASLISIGKTDSPTRRQHYSVLSVLSNNLRAETNGC